MDSVTGEKFDNQVTFSDEPAINSGDNLSNHQTYFLCPTARIESARATKDCNDLPFFELDSSPHFHGLPQQKNESSVDYYKRLHIYNHPVPALFCSDNTDDFVNGECDACWSHGILGKGYYICGAGCLPSPRYEIYHKECVESPLEIKHPHHPKHFFKLVIFEHVDLDCILCGKHARRLFYHCALCNLSMHTFCAMKPILFVLDKPKRHDHPLTFFTRRVSLDCNVCGLTNEGNPTYLCLKCNFIAHKDCAYSPGVIRISRHNHRISFVLSLPPRKWYCGVCGKNIDSDQYGGYTCNKCDDYAVHSRCALRKGDIWDGKDLEGLLEEDDIEESVEPFEIISEGTILHFSHEHPLRVKSTSNVYEERKICQACVIPIYEGDFYSCMECDFILHDTCTNAPRRKHHALHSHSLTLKVNADDGYFKCDACGLNSSGFVYQCDEKTCTVFKLDVKCASISVPFQYQGHEHPLFLALSPGEVRKCHTCKIAKSFKEALNCIECDFIVCFTCVTVPYMVRYKHDKHFLTLVFEDDKTSKPDWCEICEKESSPSGREERFYMCNHCCTTLHVDCLLGNSRHRYMKPNVTMRVLSVYTFLKVQILSNYNFSRPICYYCRRRCEDKITFRARGDIFCSMEEI